MGLLASLFGCGADGTAPPTEPTVPVPQPAADHRDLAYTSVPRRLALDLYTPAGTPPFPVVVWIHGGSWVSGVRDIFPGHPALRLRDRGYAVATIDYRLVPEGFFPAQSHDCKAALRWLRGNADRYGLDRNRIAAWGASAGGHLAALLGTGGGLAALEDLSQGHPGESSRVQAVVDWFGPADYRLADAQQQLTAALLLGCPIALCPDKAALASPVSHVDGADPPFLIQHGTADRVVPIDHSESLHGELLAAAVRSTLTRLDGAGHATAEFLTAENLARIDAFLDA
ncbi:MAG: alpha/beta hydrolase fold domain-containing protein, partial [Vicinamibacterales bacterium]